METLRRTSSAPDLQRPRFAQFALWIVVAVLAFGIAAIAALVAVGILIEPQSTEVDVARMSPGTIVTTIETADGPITVAECPSLLGRSEPVPAWCASADSISVRALVLAPLVAMVAAFAAFTAGCRAWRLVRLRTAPAPPWPPFGYHQDGMPWGFWLAAVLVGMMALVLDVIFVAALIGGGQGAGPWGAAFWSGAFILIVSRYGFRRAVSLDLEDGRLVWRAPMRVVRLPVSDVIGYATSPRSKIGERPVTLSLADGSSLMVSVPNRRHAILLDGFLQERLKVDG